MAQTTPSSSALAVQDFFSTTLSSGCTASDTTIYLTTLPTGTEGYLLLDAGTTSTQELIFYNAKGANYITVPSTGDRGIGGTTAQSHSSGAVVKQTINSDYWNSIKNGSALTYLKNGWIPGTGTWTYASSTTFTVPSADAALMSVGTKIWLTQTTSKYFYVTGVSGTTITVTGGSDYTVANAAITAPYFSNAETPVGFPQWFNYTPTWANLTNGSATIQGKFQLYGKTCNFTAYWAFGAGSAVGTNATVSLPITSANPTNIGTRLIGLIDFYDNPVHYSGVLLSNTTTAASLCPVSAGASYTNLSGTTSAIPFTWASGDSINVTGTYEVA